MLEWIWGVALAAGACSVLLSIALWVSMLLVGRIGTALLILVLAVTAVIAGWQWLIHNDSLWLQSLGWSIAVAVVLGAVKGIQVGVRKVRA